MQPKDAASIVTASVIPRPSWPELPCKINLMRVLDKASLDRGHPCSIVVELLSWSTAAIDDKQVAHLENQWKKLRYDERFA
jgi:hypothetical protein